MEKNTKNKFSAENIKLFLSNNCRFILIGLLLLANYVLFISHYTDSQGIDTQFSIFHVVHLVNCILLFILAITTFTDNKSGIKENGTESFMTIFCVCPFFLYLFSYNYFKSVNCIFLLIMLVCIYLMKNQKLLPVIPFICAVSIFIDYFFALIFLPAICLLLWNKSKVSTEKKYDKICKITVFTNIPLLIISIVFQIQSSFENVHYDNRGGNEIFFAEDYGIIQNLLQIKKTFQSVANQEFIRLVFVLPLIVFLVFFWIRCIKNSNAKEKAVYKLSFVHLFILLLPLIFYKNVGSWIAAVLSVQTALIIGFASEKKSTANIEIKKINTYLKSKKILFIAIVFLFYLIVTTILPLSELYGG